MYIDKQQAENVMISKLIKQLNIKDNKELKEYTIIIGDWQGNNKLKNTKTTLGKGMKRILKNYVKNLYMIDEYNTSKVGNLIYTEIKEEDRKTTNHYLEYYSISRKGETKIVSKKVHEILTFKMEKKSISCNKWKYDDSNEKNIENNKIMIRRFIQRDKNAVLNFKTIFLHYVTHNRERLNAFSKTFQGSKPCGNPKNGCKGENKKVQ